MLGSYRVLANGGERRPAQLEPIQAAYFGARMPVTSLSALPRDAEGFSPHNQRGCPLLPSPDLTPVRKRLGIFSAQFHDFPPVRAQIATA